jgi:hypothetical protein
VSAVVSGFGAAGAAGLLAPAASDAASAGGMAFGTALLSALAADPGASNPATPVDPSPSAAAVSVQTPAGTAPATPSTVPPAPTPAVFLGPAAPAPTVQEAVATTTPDTGSHGKQAGSTRATDGDQHHDPVAPTVADVLAGQLAVQQTAPVAPVPVSPAPVASPTPDAPDPAPAPSAVIDPVKAPSAPPAPTPTPARDVGPQTIEPATVGTAQPPAAPLVTSPARPTSKAPSEPPTPGAESSSVPTATPLAAQAPAAPTFATALAAAAPAASPAAPTPAPPLQQQLAQPVMTLARQPDGDHVVVVRVAPDDLGPVTVHARVSDTGVHIELFAPSDGGRDAIRQILDDLRRDLNATTANASVSVSDQNAPGAQSGGGGRSQWAPADERGSAAPADSHEEQPPARSDAPAQPRVLPGARTLDIVV